MEELGRERERERDKREVVGLYWCFWQRVWWSLVNCMMIAREIEKREADERETVGRSWCF